MGIWSLSLSLVASGWDLTAINKEIENTKIKATSISFKGIDLVAYRS